MPKNEIWELFKIAVMEKDKLQFNLYSLYSAINENEKNEKLNENQEEINVM